MTKRPTWADKGHRCTEEEARWLLTGYVVKIEHRWKMTGADTADNWIEVTRTDNKVTRLRADFFETSDFRFDPDHAGLVRLKPYSKVRETLKAIDDWNKANDHDRAEYERLKRKFES